ncbi:MAG: hypothetical protein ACOYIO_07325, partial [Eubacteriales bacterium]
MESKEKRRIFAAFFCIKPPQGGFIFAKPRLRRADSRFAEHRKFSSKVLIVAVRSCRCGALNRGLQNLGTSCERNVFRAFRLYEKNQKYTRGLRTSGLRGRFKALPEVSLQKVPAASAET